MVIVGILHSAVIFSVPSLQVFAIVVFATITAEGYNNSLTTPDGKCMFANNDSACSFGVGIGVLAFLACVVFLMLDAYFPNISNAQERRYIVISDLVFCGKSRFWSCYSMKELCHKSGSVTYSTAVKDNPNIACDFILLFLCCEHLTAVWTFLWFICFCVLTNLWTKTTDHVMGGDAARGVIAFSFFSILSWVSLTHSLRFA